MPIPVAKSRHQSGSRSQKGLRGHRDCSIPSPCTFTHTDQQAGAGIETASRSFCSGARTAASCLLSTRVALATKSSEPDPTRDSEHGGTLARASDCAQTSSFWSGGRNEQQGLLVVVGPPYESRHQVCISHFRWRDESAIRAVAAQNEGPTDQYCNRGWIHSRIGV